MENANQSDAVYILRKIVAVSIYCYGYKFIGVYNI